MMHGPTGISVEGFSKQKLAQRRKLKAQLIEKVEAFIKTQEVVVHIPTSDLMVLRKLHGHLHTMLEQERWAGSSPTVSTLRQIQAGAEEVLDIVTTLLRV